MRSGLRRGLIGLGLAACMLLAGCGATAPASGAAHKSGAAKTKTAATATAKTAMPTTASLKGWQGNGNVGISKAVGDPKPPSLVLPGDGKSYVWAKPAKAIQSFQFDAKTQGLFDFFFGANSKGQGYLFRIDTRGGKNYAGFTTSSSWTKWDCPMSGPTTLPPNVWIHVALSLTGGSPKVTLTGPGIHETLAFKGQLVGCTASGNNKTLSTYKPLGNAYGFQGDGLGPTSLTWIAHFK